MIKVKIFETDYNTNVLERDINNWFEREEGNIKITNILQSQHEEVIISIFYEELND